MGPALQEPNYTKELVFEEYNQGDEENNKMGQYLC